MKYGCDSKNLADSVVVNFDALSQTSDFRIERRQVVFLCWMQNSNPGSLEPNLQQPECPLTNRLSYRGSSLKPLATQSCVQKYLHPNNKENTKATISGALCMRECTWGLTKNPASCAENRRHAQLWYYRLDISRLNITRYCTQYNNF